MNISKCISSYLTVKGYCHCQLCWLWSFKVKGLLILAFTADCVSAVKHSVIECFEDYQIILLFHCTFYKDERL